MSNTTDKVGFNHFELKTTYEEMLAAGQVDENDISFVKDAGEIHVLGGTYGGNVEGFIPLCRDFNDDFNNDFAR